MTNRVVAIVLLLLLSGAIIRPGATTTPATSGRTGSTATAQPDWWRPVPGLDWQMQLSGALDLRYGRDVFFLDLFDTPTTTIDRLHARYTRRLLFQRRLL